MAFLDNFWAEDYQCAVSVFGANILTADGEMWRRHRRITAPAFNHTTYQNVWDTTVHVYAEMLAAEGWDQVSETGETDINAVTHKV